MLIAGIGGASHLGRGSIVRILFVHQNFPGQFLQLARALAARGDSVVAMTMNAWPGEAGIAVVRSRPAMASARDGHPWSRDFDAKVIRADATLTAARQLDDDGFQPDVIIAHPGWGESLFLKQLWPRARLGIYCEFFYGAPRTDIGFDPEFPVADPIANACRLQIRNAAMRLHFDLADAAIAPTRWQADSFPLPFRNRIAVIHDGVDFGGWAGDPGVSLQVVGTRLQKGDEVITFVARNLEPYRGYHVLMRALPDLLARRPAAHVVIVGGNGVSYGAPAPGGTSWRDVFLAEVAPRIERSRVHFLGSIPHAQFRAVLQLSAVHVYLTYPFVLSWSLVEAMAAGCAIVASDTAPVREVLVDGETARLFSFFDTAALVDAVGDLLDAPMDRARLGLAARAAGAARFDLAVCLARQLEWVAALAAA